MNSALVALPGVEDTPPSNSGGSPSARVCTSRPKMMSENTQFWGVPFLSVYHNLILGGLNGFGSFLNWN